MGAFLARLTDNLLVTRGVIFACVLLFGMAVIGDGTLPLAPELGVGSSFRVSTLLRFGALPPHGLEVEPLRIVSAVFFHFSALHLLFNMGGAWVLGRGLELRFGPARALIIFLLSGIAGFFVSGLWLESAWTGGASGGVFGQLGAVIGTIMANRRPGWKDLLIHNLILAVLIGLVMRVNTLAHLGGFLIGGGLGYWFARERVRPTVTRIFGVVALLGLALSVASVGASLTSPFWKQARAVELLRDG